ncbi:uncharacterized protein LOC129884227 [Solanum dulcamara]|uniref:uncharacterized protein LOC129884227 n=1 Tax=Solanum dulcamara TaxID=45834 RepID=UPI002485D504|nr:uncharacterized protein LOC129884227 [Solanum dulcamara]
MPPKRTYVRSNVNANVDEEQYVPQALMDPLAGARMNKFVFIISDLVDKEFRTSMLIKEMNISSLMTHFEQIEEEKLKEKAKESKRARTDSGDFSHSRMSNPKPQGSTPSGQNIPAYRKCWKRHQEDCLASSEACYDCGNMGHKVREFPLVDTRGGGVRPQIQTTLGRPSQQGTSSGSSGG